MCVFRALVHESDIATHARLTMENKWSEMDLIKSINLEVHLGSMTSLPNPSRLLQRNHEHTAKACCENVCLSWEWQSNTRHPYTNVM